MQFKPGDKLGPYKILAPIGASDLGEVWKAHEARLNRDVAIKTSQAGFSDRFQRVIDGRTTRHEGYALSQRERRRIETVFG